MFCMIVINMHITYRYQKTINVQKRVKYEVSHPVLFWKLPCKLCMQSIDEIEISDAIRILMFVTDNYYYCYLVLFNGFQHVRCLHVIGCV